MKIVFASNNEGKLREIQEILTEEKIEIIPQYVYGISDVDETGLSFIENALLKARHAASLTGLPAMADDSGLVVPALSNAPGIYSARYAGPHATAQQNIEKLLYELRDVPEENRDGFFYCVIVLLQHTNDPCPFVCEGIWHGKILQSPVGHKGFGYDPIFFDPTVRCSAAELSPDIKNSLSHRGQAMAKLLKKMHQK